MEVIVEHLSLQDFYNVCVNNYTVVLSDKSKVLIKKSRDSVDKIVSEGTKTYGINTGFGSLKDTIISPKDLNKLQENLIKSHAIGVGDPAPIPVVRGMLLLRLNCISQGFSGVRLEIAEKLVEALNKNFIPMVPVQGTVGASGDLAPLSHMVYSLMGESKAYDFETKSYIDSKSVMKKLNMGPIKELHAKEGLALNNGTQFITSFTALSTYNALRILKLANLIASMSIEALHGVTFAFDERIHLAKPHMGQIEVAKDLRSYLCQDGIPSDINKAHTKGKVQDAYSLRCIPQIHGASHDLIKFVENIVQTEMNSANDNPLIIDQKAISGGNFHGQYIGMGADLIALAMSYLCNNSERRLERMVNHSLNGFMPSFLTNNPGLNSGLMILQYASAGITAENRKLACPGSVDSIPTCEGSEDIVSMAGYPARKAYESVQNTYKVLAYELFTACQALEYTKEHPHQRLHQLHQYLRSLIAKVEDDQYMKPDYDTILELIQDDKIFEVSG